MAIDWDVDIELLNLAENRYRVTYTRTDSVAETVWSHMTETIVNMANLAAMRVQVTGQMWAAYSAYATEQASIEAVVPGWEAALQADITAKEAE